MLKFYQSAFIAGLSVDFLRNHTSIQKEQISVSQKEKRLHATI
jgi:hypothetical protein